MFAVYPDSGRAFIGRNFDNMQTDLLVGFYYPDSGYASIAFSPLFEFGFGPDHPFCSDSIAHKRRLLDAPALTIEGMNECGVVVTLAWLGRQHVTPNAGRKNRFLLHLVREILDHAASAAHAAALAESCTVFDNGENIICHHLLIADASESLVLEWRDGRMHLLREEGYQIVTNSPLLDISPDQRRKNCRRYAILDHRLNLLDSSPTWRHALKIIQTAARKPVTQWSAIFVPEKCDIYLALRRDFYTIYHLQLLEREKIARWTVQ